MPPHAWVGPRIPNAVAAAAAAIPTADQVREFALTADETLDADSAPYQYLTPDASGWKVYLPATYVGRQITISCEHATYTLLVHQHTVGAQLLELELAHGAVTFRQVPSSGLWKL